MTALTGLTASTRLALAFTGGALCVTGFAPFNFLLVPPLCLALLFALWQTAATPMASAKLGLSFGLGCFLGGVSWIFVSLSQFGGMAAPFAAFATFLFCAYLALYPAAAGWAYGQWRKNGAATAESALLFAGLWTISEWLRGTLFTGFPWLAVGYSQSPPSPLAGWAPLLGVYGISFFVALVGASIHILYAKRWQNRTLWLGLLILFAGGHLLRDLKWVEASGSPTRVNLLQGNVPQNLKWDPQQLALSIDTYLGLSAQAASNSAVQLTVLPETALPLFLHQVPHEIIHTLTRSGDALLGIAVKNPDNSYTNSAVALTRDKQVTSYAKRHLVPFGEFTPPGFAWFFKFAHIPMSSFSAGPNQQPLLELGGQKIAANICYEDLFGEELIDFLPEATLLINLSNTAWFGNSWAQPQHLQIAQMRALETGRTILRATNTGITAMISADGKVVAALPAFTRGSLAVDAQGYTGLTPFTRWGNSLALIIALGSCLHAWRRRIAMRAPE